MNTSNQTQALCRMLHEKLEKQNRPQGDFGIETTIHFSEGPDRWRASAETWTRLGASHFSMGAMDAGVPRTHEKSVDIRVATKHIEALQPFIQAVRDV